MNIKELFVPRVKKHNHLVVLQNIPKVLELLEEASKEGGIADISKDDIPLVESLMDERYISQDYTIKVKGMRLLEEQSSVRIEKGDKDKNTEKMPYKSRDRLIFKKSWVSTNKYTPHQGKKECARRLRNMSK